MDFDQHLSQLLGSMTLQNTWNVAADIVSPFNVIQRQSLISPCPEKDKRRRKRSAQLAHGAGRLHVRLVRLRGLSLPSTLPVPPFVLGAPAYLR